MRASTFTVVAHAGSLGAGSGSADAAAGGGAGGGGDAGPGGGGRGPPHAVSTHTTESDRPSTRTREDRSIGLTGAVFELGIFVQNIWFAMANDPDSGSGCPHMSSCEMYELFNLAGALATWKINYCTADFSRCERYQRARDGRNVPVNLMPNGAVLEKPTGG